MFSFITKAFVHLASTKHCVLQWFQLIQNFFGQGLSFLLERINVLHKKFETFLIPTSQNSLLKGSSPPMAVKNEEWLNYKCMVS